MRKFDFVLGTTHWSIMVDNYPVYRVNDNFFKIFESEGKRLLVDSVILGAKSLYKRKWYYRFKKSSRILKSLTDEDWKEIEKVIYRNYYGI